MRIVAGGMVLVELTEAMELLNKSRVTIFRLIASSELIKVDVAAKSGKLFITLESINRYKNQGPQFVLKELEPQPVRDRRRRELKKRFPKIFKSHQDPREKYPPVPGPPSSLVK